MRRIWLMVAVGMGLLTIILAAVATQLVWGIAVESDQQTNYRMFSSGVEGPALIEKRVAWTETSLDQDGGIGMIRIAGPLLIVGVVFTAMAAFCLEHALWLTDKAWSIGGALSGSIGVIMTTTAIAILAIGLQENVDWAVARNLLEVGTTLEWRAGLIMGILSALSSLTVFAAAIVALLQPSETR